VGGIPAVLLTLAAEKSKSCLQRKRTVAVNPGIATISPKQSLPVPVQFRDFFAAKTPKRSFGGDNLSCLWRSALQRLLSLVGTNWRGFEGRLTEASSHTDRQPNAG